MEHRQADKNYVQIDPQFVAMVCCRDEFELEFSGSSEPELWSFWAESCRAGALQFSSWNRADNTDNMYVKK